MEARPTSLIDLFAGERQAVIPLFQRPYTWKKEDWEPLWNDLMECYRPREDSPPARPHFLGAVVTTPVNTVPVGVSKSLVIDGQQRLTTVSLLLLAMRDAAEEQEQPNVAGRCEDHLLNKYSDGLERLKLRPTDDDLDPYRRLVERDGDPAAGSRVTEAYRYFRSQLASAEVPDTEGETADLGRLFTAVREGLQVVLIALGESDDPYVIFETLNHRGQSLTEADLVRNTVLMRFPAGGPDSPQRRVYEDLWKPIERGVCGDRTPAEAAKDLSEFFRHYTMMDGSQTGLSGTYNAVKKRLDDLDEDGLRGELKRMTRLAEVYGTFLRPADAPPAFAGSLRAVQTMKLTLCYPLLLRLFEDVDLGHLAEAEAAACLHLVESFLLRRIVCDVPSNQLRRLFSRFGRVLPTGERPAGRTRDALHTAMSAGTRGARWPDDADFTRAITGEPLYGSKNFRVAILLAGIEASFGHKEAVDPAVATIEHLFPRTPHAEWADDLSKDDLAAAADVLDRLGNLTLTAYNSELSNRGWPKKRAELAKSHFDLNREVAKHDRWDAAAIAARGRLLAERACDVWAAPASTAPAGGRFACNGPSASGQAEVRGDKFVVLAGSRCRKEPVPSAVDTVAFLRREPAEAGLLESDGDQLVLSEDVEFKTASAASAFVLGRSSNGFVDWRDPVGNPFRDSPEAERFRKSE